MSRKFILATFFLTVLIGTLGLSFEVQRVDASGTIYIRADGSIDPPDAPISTVDNVTYTLTGNITSDADGIVVERSNIVIDGNGHVLQGSGSDQGFYLSGIRNMTAKSITVKGFLFGIYLLASSDTVITGSHLTSNYEGIWLDSSSNFNSMSENNVTNNDDWGIDLYSSNNIILENNLTNNGGGIGLFSSNYNTISGNNIANNSVGMRLDYSSGNRIGGNNLTANENANVYLVDSSNDNFWHNSFMKKTQQVIDYHWSNPFVNASINSWDDGYPSGGNYWSDYNGVDANHDGIGDTSYIIDANNTDNYPLMTQYIVPEFPSVFILAFFIIMTLLAVVPYKREHYTSRPSLSK